MMGKYISVLFSRHALGVFLTGKEVYMRLFSTEQVSKWHPDKVADQISDAILFYCLQKDKYSRVAIETLVKNDSVYLAGEITCKEEEIPYQEIVRKVMSGLGYPFNHLYLNITKQSVQISAAVDSDKDIGAGDQGMMFGYATRETESHLPYGFDMANRIIGIITDDVEKNPCSILKGDSKTQVTVDLDKPDEIPEVVLLSCCHKEGYSIEEVRAYLLDLLKKHGIQARKYILNPSGIWTLGGPNSDSGLTGRKIVCDQYGGYCPVGGGSFSGKDPTKVDRSGAYMARELAILILEKFPDVNIAEVELAYGIGIAKPISISVLTDKKNARKEIYDYVSSFDLTPAGMIKYLDLRNIDYRKLSSGCHYRRRIQQFHI